MKCPHLVMFDKFFCLSEGDPRRRKNIVRREHCAGSYKNCSFFHENMKTQGNKLYMSLRPSQA